MKRPAINPGVADTLAACGYKLMGERAYAAEYKSERGDYIYLKRTKKISIAFSPELIRNGDVLEEVAGYSYWNSNLAEFPKSQRSGKKTEKFGIAFDVSSAGKLKMVIEAYQRVV